MGADNSDVLYTLPEVAVLARVWTCAVRDWVRAGRLPCRTRPGGVPRVGRSELERFPEMSEAPRPQLPDDIARYYQEVAEEGRLAAGPGQLEFVRTQEVVLRYLPPPPATLLDVGGAAGVYALWLAGRGYQVHLIDPVPRLVEEARRRSEASPHRLTTCQVGDARHLPFGDGVADGVLLLGPLYHLTDPAERRRALREVYRVLRPGGVLCAAAISRWASALDGLARDLFADPAFAAIVRQDLEQGQHRNATDNWEYFTTAYFHRPEELRAEVVSAGFHCRAVLGLEGPGWILSDFDGRWADPRKREDLLRVARALEGEVSVVGLSAHLLAVATREGEPS
jgi:ubiquinone/menaquinone biosynthesis C-methylase UbiE